jgi:hypothetical protein
MNQRQSVRHSIRPEPRHEVTIIRLNSASSSTVPIRSLTVDIFTSATFRMYTKYILMQTGPNLKRISWAEPWALASPAGAGPRKTLSLSGVRDRPQPALRQSRRSVQVSSTGCLKRGRNAGSIAGNRNLKSEMAPCLRRDCFSHPGKMLQLAATRHSSRKDLRRGRNSRRTVFND